MESELKSGMPLWALPQPVLVAILGWVSGHSPVEVWPGHWVRWRRIGHWGRCGQSCPCCRALVGEDFGACDWCIDGLALAPTCSRIYAVMRLS